MRRLILVGVVLGTACQTPPDRPAQAADTTTDSIPRTATVPLPSDAVPSGRRGAANISIEDVAVGNPLVVSGRARTFENTVNLRARAGTEVLSEEYVTSVGELGTHNPYRAELWITRQPGDSVTVEAFEYSARDGSVQSLVSRAVSFDIPATTVKLYFPTSDCTRIAEFSREVPSAEMGRLLVEALIDGPAGPERQGGASPAFPTGSAVRSVILRQGVATVDFNERLQNVGGSCAAQAIRESITRTLQQLPTVTRVVITANGSEALALQP